MPPFRNHTVVSIPFLALCAIVLWTISAKSDAQSQQVAYPTRPIRLIVPYPPGGGTDITARALMQQMSISLGQSVVIENRPGATGMIGAQAVVNAPADGYTVLFGAASEMAINASLYRKMTYDPRTQLSPVSLIAKFPLILVASVASTDTLTKLLVQAKEQPGAVTYGSIGSGSPQHLAAEWMADMAKVSLVHVPYKGSGPLLQDSIGGYVQIGVSSVPPAVQLIRAGKLRGLAVTSAARIEALPEVATMRELGFEGYEFGTWVGLAVPVGTSQSVIEQLHQSIVFALRVPEVLKTLADQGALAVGSTPEAFGKFVHDEIEKSQGIVSAAQIVLD